MDTLSTREDFLATHKEIVGIAVSFVGVCGFFLVGGRVVCGHSVEGTDGQRELVEDVEVGTVFLEDEATEVLLVGCAAIY